MTIRKTTSTIRSVEGETDDETGHVIRETWKDSAGNFDRQGDLPAVTTYCPFSGSVTSHQWYRAHKRHREGDKPAILRYFPESGKEAMRAYFCNGIRHRSANLPSLVAYEEDGSLARKFYFTSGKAHRTDGPAIYYADYRNAGPREEHWVDGQQIDPD
jgi:hypothetical protein